MLQNNNQTIDSSNEVAELVRDISEKVKNGIFTLTNKTGRTYSKVWEIFCQIQKDDETIIKEYVVCRMCKKVYKYNSRSTSNLLKHKCYIINNVRNESQPTAPVTKKTKTEAISKATMWIVEDCRPFTTIEGSGFKKLAEHLIEIGNKCGNINVNDVLPHSTTISRNVSKIKCNLMNSLTPDFEIMNSQGFAVTTDLWTDNFIRKTYITITSHFVKNGKLIEILLGLKPMHNEKTTAENILNKAIAILAEYQLIFSEKVTVVTDRGSNMIKAFQNYNHICCSNHLLHNVLEKSFKDVDAVKTIIEESKNLVKYFKKASINDQLQTTLKSLCTTRWNTVYYMLESILKNFTEINNILQQKNEISRITFINANYNVIKELVDFLNHFQKISTKIEGSSYPTVHFVIPSIEFLKKCCSIKEQDSEILRDLKLKVNQYIKDIWLHNISYIHEVATFLFPPTNKLNNFNLTKRIEIKEKCHQLMNISAVENSINEMPTLSSDLSELFGNFVNQPVTTMFDRIENEIMVYENLTVPLSDEFDVLNWWEVNKQQFPLLGNLSKRVFAIPASSAPSERVFSGARNLITDKRSQLSPSIVNDLMIVNRNLNHIEDISRYEEIEDE